MIGIILPGLGAGLVSALLVAVVAKGTPLAILLFLLAPIPILIVSLGWNHRSGLVATLIGGLATGLVLAPVEGLAFAGGTALPSWWLAYLALLGRPNPDGTVEWYPLGRLLAWIAAIAALAVLINLLIAFDDIETYLARWRQAVEIVLRRQTGTPEGAPIPNFGSLPAATIIEQAPFMMPMIAAQTLVLTLALYVWVGAKIVAVSGRLPRPWPYIPATIMPASTVLMLVAGIVMLNLSGFVQLFGLAVLGSLLAAFSLQGLASLHHVTVGRSGRTAMLWIAYLVLILGQGLLFIPLVLFAIADSAFGMRRRLNLPLSRPGLPPSPPPSPPPGPWSGRKP